MQAKTTEKATFGAGGFWTVESFFREVPGAIYPFRNFYRAEEYHLGYFQKSGLPSCHVTLPI